MSAEKLTLDEAVESLTGYDEIAIARAFGMDIGQMYERPTTLMRAAAFVMERREGKSDNEAKEAVMQMTMKATLGYFKNESDELDPEDSEQGKDASKPA